jgi:hypothetical protein
LANFSHQNLQNQNIEMKKILLTFITFIPLLSFSQYSQTQPKENYGVKISGYLQSQFQVADSAGINSWSAGNFDDNSNSRFMIRRGRIKVERVDKYSSMIFQVDGTQDGMKIMDAYIDIHPEDDSSLALSLGLFNRPYGYSIAYSSSVRHFPERARVFQTLMPRERDLGIMGSYNPKQLSFLTAKFGVVNGTGISAKDFDSKKDMVGSLMFEFDSLANKKFHVGFGGSFYKGTVRNNTDTYFTPTNTGFVANTNANNEGYNAAREYIGANLQLSYDNSFGKTSFVTEYIKGKQPGEAATPSLSGFEATTSFAKQPMGNLYVRNFNGYFFWLTQEIGKTNLTAIVGYDVYDPNLDIKEANIGLAGSNTTAADIKFATFGYGLTYDLSDRIRLTVYNEHVNNGKTQLADYSNDIKDNVFTTRLQYRW